MSSHQFMDLQYRADDLARDYENRGRMCVVSSTAETTGVGTVELPARIDFGGAIFIERPAFSYGTECDPDAVRDILGLLPTDPVELPHSTGHITAWDADENNHYNGAWVGIAVTYPVSIPITDLVTIVHHFSFSGVALKDVDPTG
jgi:hypothetical protein